VSGPAETKALSDLFDAEAEADKRDRVRKQIESRGRVIVGGFPVKSWRSQRFAGAINRIGVKILRQAERRLGGQAPDGRIGAVSGGRSAGGPPAPEVRYAVIERVKALFSGKGNNEKKITFLSERRAR